MAIYFERDMGVYAVSSVVHSLAPFCDRLSVFCDMGLEAEDGVAVFAAALSSEQYDRLPKWLDLY